MLQKTLETVILGHKVPHLPSFVYDKSFPYHPKTVTFAQFLSLSSSKISEKFNEQI